MGIFVTRNTLFWLFTLTILHNVTHASSEKNTSFAILFLPSTESEIQKFSTPLDIAHFCGTIDEDFFLQHFRLLFFSDAYIAKVLQINTSSSTE
jgi:hypothetical protein